MLRNPTSKMLEYLSEPTITYGNAEVATTITDVAVFLRIPGDDSSNVDLVRERGLDADDNVVIVTSWEHLNDIVISEVVSSQEDSTVIGPGETELSINGGYFGAELEDIAVVLTFSNNYPATASYGNPLRTKAATVVSGEDIDTDEGSLVVSVDISSSSLDHAIKDGSLVTITVHNKKRDIATVFEGLTVRRAYHS